MNNKCEGNEEQQNLKVWEEIKAKHPWAIVFIRVGKKYFTYGDDAARFNYLTGCKKTVDQCQIQRSVLSIKRLDKVLSRLVKSGCKVALCDKL